MDQSARNEKTDQVVVYGASMMAASTAAGYWPRVELSGRLLLALTYVACGQGT